MSSERRKNLKDMLDELDRYFEEFERDAQDALRSTLSSAGAQGKPFMAGFSLKLGPEGRPSVQFFGDSPVRNDGYRSPMSEQILDEKQGVLRLVLDMPGVEKSDIQVESTGDRAKVVAERGARRYRAELALRSEVDPATGRAEYKNGVLVISFSVKDKTNKGFRRLDIV
jgi:HSP20 family protein